MESWRNHWTYCSLNFFIRGKEVEKIWFLMAQPTLKSTLWGESTCPRELRKQSIFFTCVLCLDPALPDDTVVHSLTSSKSLSTDHLLKEVHSVHPMEDSHPNFFFALSPSTAFPEPYMLVSIFWIALITF